MGVKWTPEQESAIMSPKDSNLPERKKPSGKRGSRFRKNGGSCRAYYYAVERCGESFIRTRIDGCYLYEGCCR